MNRFLFPVTLRPNAGQGLPSHEVSRSHTTTHQHSVGLLWTSDQLVAETCTCTTHNTHNRQISMPQGGIRTHDLSRRAAADLRLRPRGHWDRIINVLN